MKAISYLIAALIVVVLLAGVPNAMAGAYDTGEGHGYASCASTEIIYDGTVYRIVRILPDFHPTLCKEIDQLRCAVLFRCAFGPVAYYLQGMKI